MNRTQMFYNGSMQACTRRARSLVLGSCTPTSRCDSQIRDVTELVTVSSVWSPLWFSDPGCHGVGDCQLRVVSDVILRSGMSRSWCGTVSSVWSPMWFSDPGCHGVGDCQLRVVSDVVLRSGMSRSRWLSAPCGLRCGSQIRDVTELVRDCQLRVVSDAVQSSRSSVQAINFTKAAVNSTQIYYFVFWVLLLILYEHTSTTITQVSITTASTFPITIAIVISLLLLLIYHIIQ